MDFHLPLTFINSSLMQHRIVSVTGFSFGVVFGGVIPPHCIDRPGRVVRCVWRSGCLTPPSDRAGSRAICDLQVHYPVPDGIMDG